MLVLILTAGTIVNKMINNPYFLYSKMIDTHAHIYDEKFSEDLNTVIDRAKAMGVDRMILPGVDNSSYDRLMQIVDQHPKVCYGAMGLHPTSVNDNPSFRDHLQQVRQYLLDPTREWVAIGEIGLDLYWSKEYVEWQIEALRLQLDWAVELNLPVILHVRDAWQEIFPIIESYAGKGLRGVFHSFSGTIEDYKRIESLGDFYVGISGPVTYKNSALADVVRQIPLDRIVLETDSPYLPPVPYRGKRNEPSYVERVADFIAQLKNEPIEVVDKITSHTANSIFFA